MMSISSCLPPLFLLLAAVLVAPSQCLLTHPKTTTTNQQNIQQYRKSPSRIIIAPLSLFNSRTGSSSARSSPNTNTALHLFFDNFLHPYGVSPNNHTNYDDDDDDSITYNYFRKKGGQSTKKKKEEEENYLLSLLLPKYRSPEELKSQSVEEFQRARLEQQLRVMRNEKQKMMMKKSNDTNHVEGEDNKVFMADDDDMVNRVADIFQNNRIEEQNKFRRSQSSQGVEGQLDQQQPQQQQTMNALERTTQSKDKKHLLITNEAFQRALLEERFRQSQQQQQKQKQDQFVLNMKAMEQDKHDILHLIETTRASSATSTSTDATEKSNDDDDDDSLTNDGNVDADTENAGGGSNDSIETSASIDNSGGSNNNGPPVDNDKVMTTDRGGEGGDGNNDGYYEMPINGDSGGDSTTKAMTEPPDLSTQLKSLHRMVSLATAPVPPPPSTSTAIALLASNETTTAAARSPMRIQKFLATTHLPLPPDENTPFASLALAPLAHIATSMFLSGAVLFYSMLAILDILLNDGKEEYCAKKCISKAASIWKSCWHHLFAKQQQQQQRGAMYRTMEASQTSFLALFFTCQCVIVRAATRTRYATECKDAGMGSLRYLIYATRSLNFLWKRAVSSLQQRIGNIIRSSSSAVSTNNTGMKKERRKFHLLRVLSKIRQTAARRINHQRSLLIKQQRMRAEKEFQDKVQSLNEDTLAVEREKKRLDMDRANLLSEGVGVVAWYSMTKEASDALAAEREDFEKERRRNGGGKRHWRPRFGYWGLSAGDDNSDANDDKNVDIDNSVTGNDD